MSDEALRQGRNASHKASVLLTPPLALVACDMGEYSPRPRILSPTKHEQFIPHNRASGANQWWRLLSGRPMYIADQARYIRRRRWWSLRTRWRSMRLMLSEGCQCTVVSRLRHGRQAQLTPVHGGRKTADRAWAFLLTTLRWLSTGTGLCGIC